MQTPAQKLFPANALAWVRVNRGTTLTVPVPCHEVSLGNRLMCFYPATSTQTDDMNVPDYSSLKWRRLLVEDVARGRELPLWVRRVADAFMVAEMYATAADQFDRDSRVGLDPGNWEAVSRWTLAVVRQYPGLVEPVPEWLYKAPPVGPQTPPPLA